ncbi:MAG: CocE/NonD family hydrolase [Solirubrobacterales bacterium]|nr:CocE/NonD family hydrolase [Solirubrobacterales bacterium]MCB8914738.1 CocE/NonD family hydrolase [Thermoleophilales bacterium]
MLRSFRVYLVALVTFIAGLALAGGFAASAGASPKYAPKITAKAPYTARGSVGEAYVKDAVPGSKLLLVAGKNRVVRTGKADRFGSKIFYDLKPGASFTVRTPKGKGAQGTKWFKTLKPGANPPQSFYDGKTLSAGLNYVTMRDGTELAMTVRLPLGKTMADGPFPTFVEYSGYQTAAPHDLVSSLLGGGSANDQLVPSTSTMVGSVIGPLLNFAVVSVQMRGSGCSGGAFDLFGWPTTYDGYDAIETVAAQDWVSGGKVSMGGISFSGITQLFTAGTRPPHLSAVSPLSVTDDVYYGTGFPGGIFNSGFAFSWITERAEDAEPAPEGGQPWAKVMSTTGDPDVSDPALRESQKQHCLDNQKMRLQTRDYNQQIKDNPYRTKILFAKRSPGAWVKRINVPIFWVGAFQDEQTGGHWPEAVKELPKSNRDVWVTMQNGVHIDSLGPSTITRWTEFMNLFTGSGRIPVVSPLVITFGSNLYDSVAGAGALPIQQTRYASMANTPANVATAKSDFRKDPRIRILMDNGAAIPGEPGAIGAAWEADFSSWPIRSLKPTSWYLGKGGSLQSRKAGKGSSVSYLSDPDARPSETLGEDAQGDSWLAQPPYDWQPVAKGKGLGFVSPVLKKDVFIAGPSSLDLYLKSSKRNTDIQATLTEVRPDGQETYVQNGWLRSSHRKINRKLSTAYDPVQTWLKKDGRPLKKGKFNFERIQIFPVAHVFRAGSRIRLNIQAPGGDRTIWDFDTIEKGKTRNRIGLGGVIPSKLVLPVIPGQNAQGTPLPPATALRGEPSRTYQRASNGG